MRIDILTLLPELLNGPFSASILKRAQDKGLVEIHLHNIRDYSTDKHNNVDDYQYGGGAGMVMSIEPIVTLIEKLKTERSYDEVIYLTPDGEMLEQKACNELSLKNNLMMLCGHYKGIDERIREHFITKEVSIGSYVLSGGELAAMVILDAVVRNLDGVLGDSNSLKEESFGDGKGSKFDNLLEYPHYTKPQIWKDRVVPEVLLSGHHKNIDDWRFLKAREITRERRGDLVS